MTQTNHNLLALDVGERRIGVAIAHAIARLPRPLLTLERNENIWQTIEDIVNQEGVGEIIVGLPRGLNGQETAQTTLSREFASSLEDHLKLPVYLQDEALTSKQAETELAKRGKTYAKADIDALAATYILEDFLQHHQKAGHI